MYPPCTSILINPVTLKRMPRSISLSLLVGLILCLCRPSFAFIGSQLDDSFGLNGRVAVELGVRNGGHATLVQPDGKIVIAGSASGPQGGPMNFALLRLGNDGSLDSSFNGEGSTVLSLASGDDEALAVGRLTDGRIVAGGYMQNGRDRDFALACFKNNGTLDLAFGIEGAALTAIGNGNEEITALLIDGFDRIVVVGTSEGTAGRILVAARYLPNGRLDADFGEQGISLVGIGNDISAEGVLLRRDGSLLISGSYVEGCTSRAMLVALGVDGLLDTDFAKQGVATLGEGFTASDGYGLVEDRGGLIYVAGSVGEMGKRDAALFRCTASGHVDSGFGNNGVVLFRQGPDDDVFYDLSLTGESLAAGGFTVQAGAQQLLLASLMLTDAKVEHRSALSAGGEEVAPIQDVLVSGSTRIQIRKMQFWSSEMLIRQMELMQSLWPGSPLPAAASAATRLVVDGKHTPGIETSRVATLAFGSGDAVCYAMATDVEGHAVLIGTAAEAGASSIIAARFLAEDVIDRLTDKPGHRSSHITTLPSVDITQTSISTGGEIAEAFPKEIVRRGVLYGLKPGQVYRQPTTAQGHGSWQILAATMGEILIPSAQAAEAASGPVASPASGAGKATTMSAASLPRQEGITDNGSGHGMYHVVLDQLQPGSIYYIRAYALTASGDIYYGDQITVRTADACFIATASFGSLLHPWVQVLRDFRDTHLHSALGTSLVRQYYRLSPPLASIIAQHSLLRLPVRLLLVPIIAFAWLALHLGLPLATISWLGAATLVAAGLRTMRQRRVKVHPVD